MANNKDFLYSMEAFCNEHGIDRETMVQVIEESLLTAARKAVEHSREMHVTIDRTTGAIRCIAKLIVADPVKEPENEISLKVASGKYPQIKVGDEVDWEVTPENFGRIAAQAAKQAIHHKIQQVKNKNICEQFQEQVGQLLNGRVSRIDREGVIIDFSPAEGVLRRSDRIPGEQFDVGDLVDVLLVEINEDKPGPLLHLSRSVPEFVQMLFEREVTEIGDGLVQIKAVAREAGYRSKVAVCSTESRIDPSGACIGVHGNRVRNIVRELGGEKVDVIEWSADPKIFISNALKPAKLQSIEVDEATKSAIVHVAQDQLSLAIGKKGQNARLAARLTGWKIDIVSQEESVKTAAEVFAEQIQQAIQTIGAVEGIGLEAATTLVNNGYASLEGIAAPVVEIGDLAGLPGFDADRAAAVIAAAKAALGQ